jgi:CHAD domain-containing protein
MSLDLDRVHKSMSRIDKFAQKAPKNPTPDKIHKVRTSARRLESALDTLRIGNKKTRKKLARELREIRKRCGKLRDMDVLTADAISTPPESGEQECLVRVVEHLGAKRASQAKKLRKAARKSANGIRRDLKSLTREVDRLARGKQAKNQAPTASGPKPSAVTDLATQLQSPPQLNRKNLHPYRIQVKQLRYALQLSEEAQDDEFVRALGEVKDAIGDWHDWEELITLAGEVVDHGADCKLIKQWKRIADEKFESALAVTHKMRQAYVNGKKSQSTQGKKRRLPFPVVLARSAAAQA